MHRAATATIEIQNVISYLGGLQVGELEISRMNAELVGTRIYRLFLSFGSAEDLEMPIRNS